MPWYLPPLRPGSDAPPELAARRAAMAQMAAPPPEGTPVQIVPAVLGGVECLRMVPPGAAGRMVYLHGGGFRSGSIAAWAAFGARLAMAAACEVVLVEYRLAPEHPFPAGLTDAASVYDALGAEGGGPLLVGGDSAGGGLALSLGVSCLAAGVPLPAGLVLISPWADLTATAGTYDTKAATDQLFSRTAAHEARTLYLQGHPAGDPLVSPLLAPHAGLPPTFVLAGGAEVLLDDALGVAASLARAGGSVELMVGAGMQHVYPVIFADLSESALALEAMGRFVRRLTT